MDLPLHLERLLFLFSVFVHYFGSSSAETDSGDPSGGGTEYNRQVSSYYFYQTPSYPRDCRELRDQCSSSISSGVYLIKPDGYPEPFEVYCHNDDSAGWMVIQRRLDGSLDFYRNWEDYKKGFGYLSSEFWIGNERLSFLTNQNVYELQANVFLSDNSSFHMKYNSFRISDELSQYALVAIGEYTGDSDSALTFCPQNMVYGNCSCVATCQDPLGASSCQTVCEQAESWVCLEGLVMKEGNCIPVTECECYVSEEDRVLQNGEIYINAACTVNCTCNNDQLNCNNNYACSPDATCKIKDNVRQCYCNDGYSGDGVTCTIDVYRECNVVRDAGNTQDGVYSINPSGWRGSAFDVFCNMTIDGGGWVVFQRRDGGTTSFYKNWASYKRGFGDIQDEFWLGNDKLHYLTRQGTYELRVDFVTSSNSPKYAKYASFRIGNERNNYRVTNIGTYSGNGGNGMSEVASIKFSTRDRDNDGVSDDCAGEHRGGWWYGGSDHSDYFCDESDAPCHLWYSDYDVTDHCYYYESYVDYHYYYFYYYYEVKYVHYPGDTYYYKRCAISNLHGDFNGGTGQNIFWNLDNNCNVKYTEMKIRRT